MSNGGQTPDIDFNVNKGNLYREESVTDMKVASIRKLVPITPDGADDPSRPLKFMGHTQLMSPDGPVPLHAELTADNLQDALDEFPTAMQRTLKDVVAQIQKMRQQQQTQQADDSRIIVPGR